MPCYNMHTGYTRTIHPTRRERCTYVKQRSNNALLSVQTFIQKRSTKAITWNACQVDVRLAYLYVIASAYSYYSEYYSEVPQTFIHTL